VGPAPALAEGTSGVKPAGEAERTTAAKFEALVSWAQGVARHEVEKLRMKQAHTRAPQKGEHKPEEPPRKNEHMTKASPQKGEHKIKMPSTGEGEGKPKRKIDATGGRARAQGAITKGQTQTRSAATIGQANVRSTCRRKEAQTKANAGVGVRRRENASTSMQHSQEGIQM
jgi:hypothetical protein